MQFMKILSLLQKHGILYGIFGISFSSLITWIIICNFRNFFLFSQNLVHRRRFMKFLSLLKKRGISYAIYGVSFSPQKTWSNLCNFWNFFIFSQKNGLSYAIPGI